MAFFDRVAGAPISWGVCEVPGWGLMLPTSRVLPEMKELGIVETELGAPGFFPEEKEQVKAELEKYGMGMIGGFVPLVLQDPTRWDEAVANAKAAAEVFAYLGGDTFVTAPVQDYSWPRPTALDREGMRNLAKGLALIDEVCADFGMVQALHPHVDTLIETKADVDLLLEESDVKWCLDTGHLAVGGTDPVEFARANADRVAIAHLKDVRMDLAAKALSRELSLLQAVQAGIFTPFGQGDVPIRDVVLALEAAGYQGRYVIEQDLAITGDVPAEGTGPIDNVRASIDYLKREVVPALPAGAA